MSKVKVELNHDGIREILHSAGLVDVLESEARKRATACGEGYSYDVKSMGSRVIASYFTETYDAMVDNANNNTLLKML